MYTNFAISIHDTGTNKILSIIPLGYEFGKRYYPFVGLPNILDISPIFSARLIDLPFEKKFNFPFMEVKSMFGISASLLKGCLCKF
jgi:hypothetical protein